MDRLTDLLGRTAPHAFRLLQISVICVFLGRAWQHLYWDAPFRALFWDEHLLRGPLERLFGLSWAWFSGSREADALIQGLIRGVGVVYLFAAFFVLIWPRWSRPGRFFLWLGGVNLVLLAFLESKAHAYNPAQFFEHALQFSVPFFWLTYTRGREWSQPFVLGLKIATAVAFTCHGLFAVGYYPRPAHFVEMTMQILGLDQAQAVWFLQTAGAMDFAISITIFLPGRAARLALLYAVLWGAATTLARIVAHFHPDLWMYTFSRWTYEALFRFPHFLIPLLIFVLSGEAVRKSQSPGA